MRIALPTLGEDPRPLYLQVRDAVLVALLEGRWREGEALPSVRLLAAELELNALTVLRAYRCLVDESLVERRRGRGMYVSAGCRERLLARERERFLREEWPAVRMRARRLGLSIAELLDAGALSARDEAPGAQAE